MHKYGKEMGNTYMVLSVSYILDSNKDFNRPLKICKFAFTVFPSKPQTISFHWDIGLDTRFWNGQ